MKKSSFCKKSLVIVALVLVSLFVFTACASTGNGDDTKPTDKPKEHTLTLVEATEPTCTTQGNVAYYKCSDCGKLFVDKDGKEETTLDGVVLSAKGHDLNKVNGIPATCKDEGVKEHYACKVCNVLFMDELGETEISKQDTVLPVTDNHTYGELVSDSSSHYRVCKVCSQITDREKHEFGTGTTCQVCNYVYDPAKDTAPTTMDELFPNKTATAVELAKAEYYQGVVTENLKPVFDFLERIINGKGFKLNKYSYDLGKVVDEKIDSLLIYVDATEKRSNDWQRKYVYQCNLPKPLTMQDLFNEYNETLTIDNFTSVYQYTYDTTKQGDKDDFIKAVVGQFDPDFITEDAQLIYNDNGTKLDNDYGQGRHLSVVMFTTKGIREYNIITPFIKDDQLIEYISKNKFKLSGKAEINFSNYQINVDLTK